MVEIPHEYLEQLETMPKRHRKKIEGIMEKVREGVSNVSEPAELQKVHTILRQVESLDPKHYSRRVRQFLHDFIMEITDQKLVEFSEETAPKKEEK